MRRHTQGSVIRSPKLIPAIIALAASGIAGCSSASTPASTASTHSSASTAALPGTGKPPIVMGAKNFTEELILGQLYEQALVAKGYKVTLNDSFPGVALINAALTSGKIEWYPEYTWEVITAVGGQQGRNIKTAQQAYNAANQIEQKQGFELLNMTPFTDANALAVRASYANQYHLTTIGQLKSIGADGSNVVYCDAPENRTLWTGLVGLKQAYGLTNIQFKGLGFGLLPEALLKGQCDAADIFQTDPSYAQDHWVQLKDTQDIFGFQNVAPVVSAKLVSEEGPAFAQTLNSVSALLTQTAMIRMNEAVVIDKISPAVVAQDFLKANGMA
jgi:osmoprotectant transport system substrate-binding protein